MNSGSALVPRVSNALRLDTGDPLVTVFGVGVPDVFVGTDYRERTLDEALWLVLRAAGFRRIVFSSANSPVYSLDEESGDFIRHRIRGLGNRERGASPGRAEAPGHTARRASEAAPHIRTSASPTSSSAAARTPGTAATGETDKSRVKRQRGLMLDADTLRLLSESMRIRDMPTAVVIVRAEHFLQFVGTERDRAEWFAEWAQAPADVDNVCVLVFTSRSWDGAVEFVRSLRHLNTLVSYLERQGGRGRAGRGIREIGEPDAAEIERIIDVARLRHGLRIADWREFDRIIAAIAAQPDVLAVTWARRLRGLARTGVKLSELELRDRGWVEALPSGKSAWDRLNELTGLAEVKEHIDRLRWRAEAEARRRREGLLAESGSLHLIFTGRPGTGKTTVARLIGELYREMGLLRRGHLHAPEAADLVGMYVGHTAVQTNRAVDAALDGVLFIDEAYRLSEQPGGFGQEAIDTLVTRMDNDRDRLVVIAAGYPDKMEAFLKSNPGLPRRFPRGNVIEFPDYDCGALFTILLGMLRDRGLTWVTELEPVLRHVIDGMYQARDATFGNAGEMRNLAQELETNWARRVRAVITEPVTPDDLPDAYRSQA